MSDLQFNNIFEAITSDSAEAADLEFRADLMLVIRKIIQQNEWTPRQAADTLCVAQPRISELMNGKVKLFSADKLIGFLAQLGYRIKPSFNPERQRPLTVKVSHAA